MSERVMVEISPAEAMEIDLALLTLCALRDWKATRGEIELRNFHTMLVTISRRTETSQQLTPQQMALLVERVGKVIHSGSIGEVEGVSDSSEDSSEGYQPVHWNKNIEN